MYEKEVFREALNATAENRGSLEQISDTAKILRQISESDDLKQTWIKYQQKFVYARDISYQDIVAALMKLI